MLTLTGLCTVLVAGILFVILGYLAWNGARSLSIDFFTHNPATFGEAGGGIAPALVGTFLLVLIAVNALVSHAYPWWLWVLMAWMPLIAGHTAWAMGLFDRDRDGKEL